MCHTFTSLLGKNFDSDHEQIAFITVVIQQVYHLHPLISSWWAKNSPNLETIFPNLLSTHMANRG